MGESEAFVNHQISRVGVSKKKEREEERRKVSLRAVVHVFSLACPTSVHHVGSKETRSRLTDKQDQSISRSAGGAKGIIHIQVESSSALARAAFPAISVIWCEKKGRVCRV